MGISRGFRKLSLMAGFLGLLLVAFLRANHPDYAWEVRDYIVALAMIVVQAVLALFFG